MVERVVVLSERLQQSQEKVIALQKDSRRIAEENRRLQALAAAQEADLKQARKELADGNNLLMEMRGELERWKRDVLGFRKEMQVAQQAQLEATAKVIQLLGGETHPPKTIAKEAASVVKTPAQPGT